MIDSSNDKIDNNNPSLRLPRLQHAQQQQQLGERAGPDTPSDVGGLARSMSRSRACI